MEIKAFFLGALKYEDKVTNEPKLRFSYLLNDQKAIKESDRFVGLNELSFYTDKVAIFDEFKGDDCLQPITLVVEEVPSTSNPLKTNRKVVEIKKKDKIISLL